MHNGNGVYKSVDGGLNWINIFGAATNANVRDNITYIQDIIAWNNPSTNQTEEFFGSDAMAYYEASPYTSNRIMVGFANGKLIRLDNVPQVALMVQVLELGHLLGMLLGLVLFLTSVMEHLTMRFL